MISFLLWPLLSVALLCAMVQAGAMTFPATIEVDLIFPRNDTYAPSALFPIVFAFQNAALAPSLDPGFDLTLKDVTNYNSSYSADLNLTGINFSRSDPTYVYTSVSYLNTTADGAARAYYLVWDFVARNCSLEGGELEFGGGFQRNVIEFTIQSGAQPPDLIAATASAAASCSNMSHFAFNLTGTQHVILLAEYDNHNTCAVFSDVQQPRVAGNPCAIQVSSVTASSISAALTATACTAEFPVVSCPQTNAAPGGLGTGYMGYAAVLARLLAAFVVMYYL